MSSGPTDLLGHWRSEAETLEKWGDERLAEALERCAQDVERWWARRMLEPLTIEEAAEESGYSRSRLYQLVESGEIPNAGAKGSPRIHRRDLPRKPGTESQGNGGGIVDDDLLRARFTRGRS